MLIQQHSSATIQPPAEAPTHDDALAGGGEMGALIRATDWSQSPFGPAHQWPQSLRTALSIMLESRFAMVVAWGPEFRFFYNNGYRPVLGTKHPAALGKPGHEIFPEVWDVVGPEFERVRRGESFAVEDWLLPLDRNGYLENCWFTLSYSPIRDETGGIGGLLAVVAETTDRVQSERRLATLRELARSSNDVTNLNEVCQRATRILGANPVDVPFSLIYAVEPGRQAARLVGSSGLTNDSPAGVASIDLTAGSLGSTLWPLAEAIERRETVVVDDLPRRFGPLPGGPFEEFTHTAVVVPLARSGGADVYGAVVFGVSPRRALDDRYRDFLELAAEHIVAGLANASAYEAERRRAEMLAELDRAKTVFFSNVSHEFRTPLTLMIGPLEDLLSGARGEITEPVRHEVSAAHRNALRLLRLVNSLLDFSRLEAGRARAVYEPLDLAAVTTELTSVFRSAVERAGLRFEVHCEPLPEPVYADRSMWEKILFNLLSNALKFTFAGEIAVSLRAAEEFVELRVRDTGIGIPLDEQANVFKRFHRVQDARARTHEGSGIGLALVQDLAALHGGDVRVVSAPNEGSTFTVRIRRGVKHLAAEQVGGTRSSDANAIRADAFVEEALRWLPGGGTSAGAPTAVRDGDNLTSAARILVVDDNADMRSYLERLLQSRYLVETAANGEEALAAIATDRPDLVLSDVMMPRLDGFGLVRALRASEQTRGLPVILLSARAGEESAVEGLSEGVDDYIVKPFAARELLARVQTHIELARARTLASLERARAAEAERKRIASMFEAAPALIAMLRGPEHVFEAANAMYRSLVGGREVIGKTVREALPEIVGQGYFELLDRVFATGEPYVGTELQLVLRTPSGAADERFVNFVYQPLRDADGRVTGVFVHGQDVTAQVRARREVQTLYERVQEANNTKMKFLAAMSHELRTPLNAVLGYADLLSLGVRGALLPDQQLYLDRIVDAARYLLGLINDILNFTRVEAGHLELDMKPVALPAVVKRVRDMVGELVKQSGLRLECDAAPDVTVLGDAERIQQILVNLLTNATKFTAEGGMISLTCEVGDDSVRLHVRDTGCGIADAEQERVFEPFVQIGRTPDRSGRQGVGLGLAISRDLARGMGGDVTLTSTLGEGSDFVLRLKRAR